MNSGWIVLAIASVILGCPGCNDDDQQTPAHDSVEQVTSAKNRRAKERAEAIELRNEWLQIQVPERFEPLVFKHSGPTFIIHSSQYREFVYLHKPFGIVRDPDRGYRQSRSEEATRQATKSIVEREVDWIEGEEAQVTASNSKTFPINGTEAKFHFKEVTGESTGKRYVHIAGAFKNQNGEWLALVIQLPEDWFF